MLFIISQHALPFRMSSEVRTLGWIGRAVSYIFSPRASRSMSLKVVVVLVVLVLDGPLSIVSFYST